MKQEFEDKFQKAFPLLYREGAFLPGDGWYQLLWDLSEKLEKLIEAGEEDPDIGRPYAVQVKEKFGGLRFYLSHETAEMAEAIRVAERLSEKTCEWCGAPGTIRPGGWLLTLCDSCQQSRTER